MAESTAAPELTAEQVQRILVQSLEAVSQFLASGPCAFYSAGPVHIPTLGGPTSSAGVQGERSAR